MDDDLTRLRQWWRAALDRDPQAQADVLRGWLASSDAYSASSADRLGRVMDGLARRHAALGHRRLDRLDRDDAEAFVHARTRRGAAPSVATTHLRRTVIRTAVVGMRQLGSTLHDPTDGLTLADRTRCESRPLELEELSLLRVAATSRTRRRDAAVAAVALMEAGATSGETAALRWGQVDLDRQTVSLPGAGRVTARQVTLTPWGARHLTGHHHRSRPTQADQVVYAGAADPDSDTAQAAVTTRLRKLMRTAGLTDADLRPGSIRLCLPAAAMRDGARIEDVARTLGLASLDVTCELLGHRWNH